MRILLSPSLFVLCQGVQEVLRAACNLALCCQVFAMRHVELVRALQGLLAIKQYDACWHGHFEAGPDGCPEPS